MPAREDCIEVEVVYALPGEQVVHVVSVPRGATLREAIARSGILARYPEIESRGCPVGVFGERMSQDSLVSEGARIEIYRPLIVDPKESRRRRASQRASRGCG